MPPTHFKWYFLRKANNTKQIPLFLLASEKIANKVATTQESQLIVEVGLVKLAMMPGLNFVMNMLQLIN